jgi:hypothetical protein
MQATAKTAEPQKQSRMKVMAVLFVVCLIVGHQLANELFVSLGLHVPAFDNWAAVVVFVFGKAGLGLAVGGGLACLADAVKNRLCAVGLSALSSSRIRVIFCSGGIPVGFSGGLFRPPRRTP